MRLRIEQSRTELYTSRSGLALVGLAINRHTSLARTARTVVKRHGIPNIELIRTCVGQLAIGKSDFDAIDNARDDRYFRHALGIRQMPSSARLRQRFDEDAAALIPLVDDASIEFVRRIEAPVTALSTGHVALDIDGFPMDNSGAGKEGVSRTYNDYDGYVPMAAYLGREGWAGRHGVARGQLARAEGVRLLPRAGAAARPCPVGERAPGAGAP